MVDTKVVRIDEDLLPVIRRYSDGSVSEGIRAMHKIVVEKEQKRLSLEEVSEAVRKVVQVEGVMLHERQKSFFRDLFSSMMQVIRPGAGQ